MSKTSHSQSEGRVVMSYQGWENEQTWCVAAFLNNTPEHQNAALEACDGGTATATTLGTGVLQTLCDRLKGEIQAFAPWAWPEGYRYEQVNWIELAEHFGQKNSEIRLYNERSKA